MPQPRGSDSMDPTSAALATGAIFSGVVVVVWMVVLILQKPKPGRGRDGCR